MSQQRPSGRYVIPALRDNTTVARDGEGNPRENVAPIPAICSPQGPSTSTYYVARPQLRPQPIEPPIAPDYFYHRQQHQSRRRRQRYDWPSSYYTMDPLASRIYPPPPPQPQLQPQDTPPYYYTNEPIPPLFYQSLPPPLLPSPLPPPQQQQLQLQNGASYYYTNEPIPPPFYYSLPPQQQREEEEEEKEKEEPEHLSIASLDGRPELEDDVTRENRDLAGSGEFGAVGQVRLPNGKWGPRPSHDDRK
ncbi:hypothetical protein F4678DRAFT_479512 [Xylaria arbuscula]|nr:hypothetical protein F4678DRAFT_479512 [Xylaria arbuscula]